MSFDKKPYKYHELVDPSNSHARQMCQQTYENLERAVLALEARMPGEVIQQCMDAAVGHQILCRHYAYGHHDYEKAINDVMDLAAEMGIPYRYRVEGDILYATSDVGPSKRREAELRRRRN